MSITKFSDDEFIKLRTRNRALNEIMCVTRVGEVEGIRFDLWHPEIDPKYWEMENIGVSDGSEPRRRRDIPFIWFPWFEHFDLEKLKREVAAEAHAAKNRPHFILREAFGNISDSEYEKIIKRENRLWSKFSVTEFMRREMKERMPDAVVNAGDLIVPRKIFYYVNDDVFRPEAERGVKCMLVNIRKKNGDIISLDKPIIMRSITRLSRVGGRHPIYAIMERVRRNFGIEDFSSKTLIKTTGNFTEIGSSYRALNEAGFLQEHYLSKFRNAEEWETVNALDHACLLGYYWAKAEHDLHMRPYAEVGLKNVARARAAGKKSGQSRLQEARETWEPHALSLAVKARATDPTVSVEALATRIRGCWRLAIKIPAHSTLTNFIARSEDRGELPRKTKRTP